MMTAVHARTLSKGRVPHASIVHLAVPRDRHGIVARKLSAETGAGQRWNKRERRR
jgi:hypothetical protein